jgi:hypothetical protein
VHASPSKWKAWLPLAEYWYNTTYHTSLGCSPFKVVYGYEPFVAAAPAVHISSDMQVSEMLEAQFRYIEMLKVQLARAQNRMKQQANKLRTDRIFQVGEMVLSYNHMCSIRLCFALALSFLFGILALSR